MPKHGSVPSISFDPVLHLKLVTCPDSGQFCHPDVVNTAIRRKYGDVPFSGPPYKPYFFFASESELYSKYSDVYFRTCVYPNARSVNVTCHAVEIPKSVPSLFLVRGRHKRVSV
jgi:hypothetical protein